MLSGVEINQGVRELKPDGLNRDRTPAGTGRWSLTEQKVKFS
jgi:hypothetical protein